MTPQLSLLSLNKSFEDIKKLDDNGVEYWEARELMPVLGYLRWENSITVISKAMLSCQNSGESIQNHFRDATKMVQIGSSTIREVKNLELDRYACYLIAQNGDPRKSEIAEAQTYFAIQTRRQELIGQMDDNEKRLYLRGEVSAHNISLFSSAKSAGVTNFGSFNDAGYLGLYNMHLSQVEEKKNIKKGELLDHAGATELAANLFRITQTDAKLKREKIVGQDRASRTHYEVGKKVRQTIKELGGTMPERLPIETNIKKLRGTMIKKRIK